MNLILFGPPGVGKGTQAEALVLHYNLAHISTGDILRSAIAAGSELGTVAKGYVESGGLVPDTVIIGLVREVLQKLQSQHKGFLLDGFPRTVEQARALDQLFAELHIVDVRIVMLEAPEDELIERLVNRGIEQGRKDDTAETIRHRLTVYRTQTEPVKTFYQTSRAVDVVNGLGTVDEVAARIKQVLSGNPTTARQTS